MRTLCLVLLVAGAALAQNDPSRRVEIDAGVHVPVLTRPPELLEFVKADYPPAAFQQGLTGDVRLLITIAADGTVTEALVPEPIGGGFDEAAIAAAKRFAFRPAEVDGLPAPVQIEYLYHFVVEVPDAGPPPELDAGPPPRPRAILKGQLIARGSRTRIEGGTVRCMNEDAGGFEGIPDKEGRFELELYAGPCRVKVMVSEFNPFETTETLAPGETAEVVYYVQQKAIGYETVVRGQREKKEVVRRTLERQEMQKIPGSFGDPVRVIQNFPGVARAPFIGGQLIVRGASPSQTLTFLDGVEIPILYHLGGGPSVVNAEFLDKIDFYPGGFGARYGRAVGGVVDVSTRRGASDTWHGSAKIDLQDTALFVEAPLTKEISVAAAVRRSYIDVLLPLVLPKDPEGGTVLILPRYWDYQVRADYGKKGAANTASLMAFGSDDQLSLIATGGGRNRDVTVDVHTNFHRLVGTWVHRAGNVQLKMTPYVGYDLVRLELGILKIRADQYELGIREDLELEVNKHFTLRTGVDLVYDQLGGQAELPAVAGYQYASFPGAEPKLEVQQVAAQLESFDGAAYLEGDLKVGKLTVTPGIRLSTSFLGHNQTRHSFDPRLWARFEPWDGTAFKGSLGLYTQPPEATSMEPPPFGTPTLIHEKAFQTSLGIAQKITDDLNVDVTGFYNRRFDNVSSPGERVQNDDGSVTTYPSANKGLGRAYGVEVMLRHEVTKNFFGWLAYTLSRAEGRVSGSGQPYVVNGQDQTHILTLVGSYRLPWGFELGARFRYVTGVPKSPLIHAFDLYNADSDSYNSTRGAARSARVRDFHQLDVRLDKSFLFDNWTLGIFVDVQNVYNQKNVEGTFFDYRFRQEFEVPGIPILPVLGVKGTF